MKKRMWALFVLSIYALTVVLSGCSAPAEEATGEDDGKYRIALSNSYVGNDWRQLMIKSAVVAAEKDEYKDIVELTVVNSEHNPESQSASIDALVAEGYDAILIDAASTTGLTTSIKRAMDAGVVCVTFDAVADVEGIYTVSTNFEEMATGWANYLVAKLEAGDKIAIDTGLSGSTVGNVMYEKAIEIFDANGIEVVAEFSGEFADGAGQQAIASVLAANPDLDGMYTQVYGETIQKAFEAAGRDFIPCAAYTTNAGHAAAVDSNMDLVTADNYAGQSVLAMDIAIKVLNGETVEKTNLYTPAFFATEEIDIGFPCEVIEEDVNFWRDLPGALMLPIMPADFPVQITGHEVADYELK